VRLGAPYFLIIIPSQMNLDSIDFKASEIIKFIFYIIPLIVFVTMINAKVDVCTTVIQDLKNEKREYSNQTKADNILIQNDVKALQIRAELNRQNIEIMKTDVEMLKTQYQNR
jgi:L-cystine uptake protein TcyP (sodium:dicarboxylate symporter family)